jgi:hypothetical protein
VQDEALTIAISIGVGLKLKGKMMPPALGWCTFLA